MHDLKHMHVVIKPDAGWQRIPCPSSVQQIHLNEVQFNFTYQRFNSDYLFSRQ
jgi:hypothetical protein